MKEKLFLFCFILVCCVFSTESNAQLLEGYNTRFYPTVFDAAENIAMPFLLQQGYKTLPGVQIHNDSMLSYNGSVYRIVNIYQNPEESNLNHYYIEAAQYGQYGIEVFNNVWHINIPNVFYSSTDTTFSSMADCVGFGTRLLSSVGDTTESGNAYLSLIKTIKNANTTMMAVKGYVASAYEIGAAFPVLSDLNPGGWEYVSGNIIADSINAYNHRVHPKLNEYNGRIKGQFNNSLAGDILAFSYAPGGESNGHFMVMSAQPYRLNLDSMKHYYPNVNDTVIQNFSETYNVFAVPVYDCSGRNAHFNDSRLLTSGIGHGTLWILTQPGTDIPMGLIFKEPSDTTTSIHTQMLSGEHTWAITVGRYNRTISGSGNNGINSIPQNYSLGQNFPNPFNPATTIHYTLEANSQVKISIFDVLGREAAVPVNEFKQAGSYELSFNASGLSSGIYYYRINAGSFTDTKKMILIK
jgi:hypothetical protein